MALVILFLSIGLFYFFGFTSKLDNRKSSKQTFFKELPAFLSLLHERWEYGDIENLWGTVLFECSDIPNLREFRGSYSLRCNDAYIKCFLEDRIKTVSGTLKTKNHQFSMLKGGFDKSFIRGDLKIDFFDKVTGKEFSVRLEHRCHDAYLPEKIYSGGPEYKSLEVWDNYNRKIFIDKKYVTNGDISKWNALKKSGNNWEPSLSLSLIERKEYCYSLGKKLLQSHMFDASVFYPSTFRAGFLFKPKYPWSKSGTFLKETKVNLENCLKMYTTDCGEKGKKSRGISWNGIYHSLGDEMESFENIFVENANLKVSHKNLSRSSAWHRNGLRAYWSGKKTETEDFNFKEHYLNKISEKLEGRGVAFRCMAIK